MPVWVWGVESGWWSWVGGSGSAWRRSASRRSPAGVMANPRQPAEARSSTAHASEVQECSPGRRPITLTRRGVSPKVRSMIIWSPPTKYGFELGVCVVEGVFDAAVRPASAEVNKTPRGSEVVDNQVRIPRRLGSRGQHADRDIGRRKGLRRRV